MGLGLLTSLLAVSRKDGVKGWRSCWWVQLWFAGRLVLEGQPSRADVRAPHRDSWPPLVCGAQSGWGRWSDWWCLHCNKVLWK